MGARRRFVFIGAIVLLGFIGLIATGYWFNWNWTGLSQKTLWDWLQLLIIPLVLAVVALLFNLANTRTEQRIAAQRYEQDQYIALDKQREDLLQAYLDRMSELLLEKNLRSSQPEAEARNVARARTIAILFQLDARRIGYVFAFLRESGLMSTKPNGSIVSLSKADLKKINLSQADLRETDLREAFLTGAILIGANLNIANLSNAILNEANLSQAYLSGTILNNVNLYKANLSGAYIGVANLSGAILMGANLNRAILTGANLSGASLQTASLVAADLTGADLTGTGLTFANLSGANLGIANLNGATGITIEELEKQAKSLQGATMPDGSIHP